MHDRLATPGMENDIKCKSDEHSNKAVKQETFTHRKIKTSNNKATFNLSKKILRRLEACWKETRSLTENKQISKVLIVEKALELALKDFHTKKQKSCFYSKLVSNKKIIQ